MATTVEIQRPWRELSVKKVATAITPALIPIVIASILVKTTGLDGKLGFVFSWVLASSATIVIWPIAIKRRATRGDLFMQTSVVFAGGIFLGAVLWLFQSVLAPGLRAFRFSLLVRDSATVGVDTPLDQGGLLHAILGSLVIVGLATLISVPFGILAALYITEVRGRLVPYTRFFIQAMSGVPSIVAGLFIYAALIVSKVLPFTGFTGALALAILMLPTVARTAEEVIRLVPDELRYAALALGGTQMRTVLQVVLPSARNGLITATILGIARVAGETAPLLLTAFGSNTNNLNPFEGTMATLPWYIFTQMTLGTENDVARAWVAALVLMVIVALFFVLARTLGKSGPARR
jgi:phosphate transport system permease protein